MTETVRLFRILGFSVHEADEGKEHDPPFPYIVIDIKPADLVSETGVVLRELGRRGIPVHDGTVWVQGIFDPVDESANIIVSGLHDGLLGSARLATA